MLSHMADHKAGGDRVAWQPRASTGSVSELQDEPGYARVERSTWVRE
jgi:hypothetical protein